SIVAELFPSVSRLKIEMPEKPREGKHMARPFLSGKTLSGRIVLTLFVGLLFAGLAREVFSQEKQPAKEETAPVLDRKMLDEVVDKKPLPVLKRIGPGPKDVEGNKEEFDAYCQVVLIASKTSAKAFANSSRPNRHVTWGHMYREPAKYRGEVV